MNNVVLTEAKLKELEQFGRFFENIVVSSENTKLFPSLSVLDGYYKEMLERIKQ